MYDIINDLFNGGLNPYQKSRSSDNEYVEAELIFTKVCGQIMKSWQIPSFRSVSTMPSQTSHRQESA